MIIQDAVTLLKLMGVDEDSIIEDVDRNWVRSACPLAPATHLKGIDEHPSFGIHVREGEFSQYKCFTCGRGTVSDLVHRYNFLIQFPNSKVSSHYIESQYLEKAKQITYKDKYAEEDRKAKDTIKVVPKELVDKFPLIYGSIGGTALRAKEYLLKRGISLDVAYQYQIRFDDHSNLVFPFIDTDNQIYGMHIRSIESKTFWHFSDNSVRYNKPDCWFGMQEWDYKKPTILTEGQFDLLRIKSVHPEANVIASCGTPSHAKLNRLLVCKEIICAFDADDAGDKYVNTVHKHIVNSSALALIYKVDWSQANIKDAGELFDEVQYLDCMRSKTRVGSNQSKILIYRDKYTK